MTVEIKETRSRNVWAVWNADGSRCLGYIGSTGKAWAAWYENAEGTTVTGKFAGRVRGEKAAVEWLVWTEEVRAAKEIIRAQEGRKA